MSIQKGNFGLVAMSTEGSSSGYFTQVSEPWPVGILYSVYSRSLKDRLAPISSD